MTDKIVSLNSIRKELKVKRDILETTYSSSKVVATVTHQDSDGRIREGALACNESFLPFQRK